MNDFNEEKVKFEYVGDDADLADIFNDPSLYIMADGARPIEGPITSDALFDRFEVGPGHVFSDGSVMRYESCVGRIGKEFVLKTDA